MHATGHRQGSQGSGDDRLIRLTFISGDDLVITTGEIPTILRHRNCLLFFTGVVGLLMLLGVRAEARNFLPWQNALFYGLVLLVATLGIAGALLVIRHLQKGRFVTIHTTPLIAISAGLMIVASEVMVAINGGQILDRPLEYALLWFLFYTLAEIVVIILCTIIAPSVLHDIRNRPAPATPVPPAAEQAEPSDASMRMPGDLLFDPATVRHVRAEGNYVDIRTDTDRYYLLTTFATVLSALDPAQGRQVHRSHWVAARVLAGFYRAGRDIVIRLQDGTEIHVAQSRQKDVLPWLETVSVRLKGDGAAP